MRRRYELQMKHPTYGWVSAGNFDAATKARGLHSLGVLGQPFGPPRYYRLVALIPREIKRIKSAAPKKEHAK